MGHYYSPPPPIVSATGAQPYAGNKLPPQITAVEVDNPPFVWQQIPTWEARRYLPTLPRYVAQASAVVVPKIPFSDAWLTTTLTAWVPPDPSPTLPRNLNPQITAVEVDNPPFVWQQIPTWSQRGGLPQTTKFLPQPFISTTTQSVFSQAWLTTIIQAWQPPDPLPTLPKNLSPGIPGQSVDNPPLLSLPVPVEVGDYLTQQVQYKVTISGIAPVVKTTYAPQWLAIVIQAWVPPDFQPTLPKNLNPSITAVPVNNPPFTNFSRTATFWTTIAAWEIPPPPQPQQTRPSYIVTILPPVNLKTYSYISSSYIQ